MEGVGGGLCGGLTPASIYAPTNALAHTAATAGQGRQLEVKETEKLPGLYKDILRREWETREKASDAKAVPHHLPPEDQCPASVCRMAT